MVQGSHAAQWFHVDLRWAYDGLASTTNYLDGWSFGSLGTWKVFSLSSLFSITCSFATLFLRGMHKTWDTFSNFVVKCQLQNCPGLQNRCSSGVSLVRQLQYDFPAGTLHLWVPCIFLKMQLHKGHPKVTVFRHFKALA